MSLTIRAVQPGDVEALLANLRPADRAECAALVGPGKEHETLRQSLDASVFTYTAAIGDEIMAIFGLAPVALGDQGLPWLLGTALIDRFPSAFTRASRPYISRMLTVCPQLVNVVDARNVKAIAWLKRMGFEILPLQPIGAAGLPFHPFILNA